MAIRVIRTINRTQVYNHCVEHDYYTEGTNEEYSAMLDKCSNYEPIEASDEDIMAIAKDIWNHSSCEEFGGTFADFLWGIYNKCLRYEIVED